MITISNKEFSCFYVQADQQAIKNQKRYMFLVGTSIVLLTIAALLTYIYSFFATIYLKRSIATLLFINLLINASLYVTKVDKLWYDYRSIAESLKTLTWKYMVKAVPFSDSDKYPQNEFRRRIQNIIKENEILFQKCPAIAPEDKFITNKMSEVRNADLRTRQMIYTKYRIKDQAKWYAKKATDNQKMGKYFTIVYVSLNLAILILLIFYSVADINNLPLDFFMVLLMGISTWTQAKKYNDLANAYVLATHDIKLMEKEDSSLRTEEDFSNYVANCENAFSREHTQWYARKQ